MTDQPGTADLPVDPDLGVLPCAACAGQLVPDTTSEPGDGNTSSPDPFKAQVLVSVGHPGSTCFQPETDPEAGSGGEALVIHICKNCLHHMARWGRVGHDRFDQPRTRWRHGQNDHIASPGRTEPAA